MSTDGSAVRALALALVCTASIDAQEQTPPDSGQLRTRYGGNVLLVVADDLGIDMLPSYGIGADLPITPNLDALATSGVQFRTVWSNPNCSPTRATLLTGRYGFRQGMGDIVESGIFALPTSELALPEALAAASPGHATACLGKWHLGQTAADGLLTPNASGFAHFEGTFASLQPSPTTYWLWPKVVNGVQGLESTYATRYTIDAAVQWIAAASEPWFCYVPLHTPHAPFHAPEIGTYSEDLTGLNPQVHPRQHYKAMVESLDYSLGDLLARIGDDLARTTVIFLGDNGTPQNVAAGPFTPTLSKGTVYEGGVRVPLIVSGPLVRSPGREVTALVNVVDLFPTLLEIADVDAAQLAPLGTKFDGVSLLRHLIDPGATSQRAWIYTERFKRNGSPPASMVWAIRALRDTRYKLVQQLTGDELFDLQVDPFEQNDLLLGTPSAAESAAYAALSNEIATLIASY